jgi:hypothetical protein
LRLEHLGLLHAGLIVGIETRLQGVEIALATVVLPLGGDPGELEPQIGGGRRIGRELLTGGGGIARTGGLGDGLGHCVGHGGSGVPILLGDQRLGDVGEQAGGQHEQGSHETPSE